MNVTTCMLVDPALFAQIQPGVDNAFVLQDMKETPILPDALMPTNVLDLPAEEMHFARISTVRLDAHVRLDSLETLALFVKVSFLNNLK